MNVVKKTLKIDNMHCTSCAMLIDGDLEDLEGVISANTNYAKQICEVEYDQEIIETPDILITIKKTGYNAELATQVI